MWDTFTLEAQVQTWALDLKGQIVGVLLNVANAGMGKLQASKLFLTRPAQLEAILLIVSKS